MTLLLLCGVSSVWGETKTLIIDGTPLPSTATTNEADYTYGDFTICMSPGAKLMTSTGDNKFTTNAILIGKEGKYIYNKTAIPGKITKFEIYANKGASAKVSVGVIFSKTALTTYATGANTYTATLSTLDEVYDCSSKLPEDAQYFWFQVTNANNSQVQFRITYEEGNTPSILANNVNLEANATSGEIAYTISNPVEGKSLTAETSTEWISNVTVDAANSKVTFNTTANAGAQREGTITLKYDGATNKNVTITQAKPTTFASIEALVAAGAPASDGTETVTVTLTDEVIKSFYTSSGYRNGIFLNYTNTEGKDIEIYCKNVPEAWIAGGTLSGTLENCSWKIYSGTWELCPANWDELTYTAPKEISSIEIGGTATKTVYTEGEFFNDYSGLTVTATYTDNTTDDVTGLVKWSVNPSTALTTDVKSVTVTASINEVTDDAVVNITVNPEPTNFVWDLTIDETTTATASEISWVNAIANIKASGSTTAANNYYPGTPEKSYTSTRFYKGATFTISPKNGHEISSIVLDATTDGYATTAAGTWNNASASKKDMKVTVTPTDGSADVSITLTNTVGLYSIKVYYTIPTEYTRTVTAGNFGTICLPYDGTVEGATLYSIAGKEMDGEAVKNLVLNQEGNELMGGMPYVFKATAGTLTVSYDSNDTDAEDATDFEGLYGTYDAIAKLPDNGTVYVISQNKFWCVNSEVSCGANRAYIVLSEVKEASAANNLIIGNGNLADGINAVVVAPAGSKMYNLNGQAVGADYKGVVIMNGKKMFNK